MNPTGFQFWTKDACDKQPYDPSDDPDEAIYWTKWRAPKWFFMQPFANRPYDRATAWERMDEGESKHLLEVVEDRFNQRLIMALDDAVDATHIRLAKRESQDKPTTNGVVPEPAPQVASGSPRKEIRVREPKSEADLWRHFHERFQSLADEEVEKEAARRDRFLRAHFTYRKETEIFHVRDARWTLALFYRDLDVPETARVHTATNPLGPFCLLEPPQSGLWTLSDGVNENLRERLQTLAARAAITLDCTKGTDPVDFWLHRLLHDLRENQSKLLFGRRWRSRAHRTSVRGFSYILRPA